MVNPVIIPTLALTGQTFVLGDYTGLYDPLLNLGGYNFPNVDISSITRVRFIFSSYLKQVQRNISVTNIQQGVEYIVGGTGSFTYDTKTFSTGDIFISYLAGTPTLTSCTLSETGRFAPISAFLPINVTTQAFTPSSLGINDLIYPDSTYNCLYELYTGLITAGSGIAAGRYLVSGTPGQTVTISGVTYRIGEEFTHVGTFTMTGTGTIHLYNASTLDNSGNVSAKYFQLNYHVIQSMLALENAIALYKCGCDHNFCQVQCKVQAMKKAIDDAFELDIPVNISGTQTLMNTIVELIDEALNDGN